MRTYIVTPVVKFTLAAVGVFVVDIAAFLGVLAVETTIGDIGVSPDVKLKLTPLAAIAAFGFAIAATAVFAHRFSRFIGARPLPILIVALPLWAFAMAMPAIGCADTQWYSFMARVWTEYGLNPYLTAPAMIPTDPALPMIGNVWVNYPMVYGPLWPLISAAAAMLVGNHQLMTGEILKIIVSAAYLFAGWYLFRRPSAGRGPLTTIFIFWCLNPMVVFEVANSGHNDGLIAAFTAVAVTGLITAAPIASFSGIVSAALIKYWPFFLLPAVFSIRGASRRSWILAVAAAVALLLSFVPFWSGGAPIQALIARSNIHIFQFVSPLLTLMLMVVDDFVGLEPVKLLELFSQIGPAIVCVVAVVVAVAARFRGWRPLRVARIIAAAFFLVGSTWLPPWYLVSILPLVWPIELTDQPLRCLLFMVWLSFTGFVAYTGPAVLLGWIAVSAAIYLMRRRFKLPI